jgi:hypothetical protein
MKGDSPTTAGLKEQLPAARAYDRTMGSGGRAELAQAISYAQEGDRQARAGDHETAADHYGAASDMLVEANNTSDRDLWDAHDASGNQALEAQDYHMAATGAADEASTEPLTAAPSEAEGGPPDYSAPGEGSAAADVGDTRSHDEKLADRYVANDMRSYGTPEYDKAAANLIAGKPDAEDRGHIAFQVGSVRGGAGAQSGMSSPSELRTAGSDPSYAEITDRAATHYDSVGARYGAGSTPTSASSSSSDFEQRVADAMAALGFVGPQPAGQGATAGIPGAGPEGNLWGARSGAGDVGPLTSGLARILSGRYDKIEKGTVVEDKPDLEYLERVSQGNGPMATWARDELLKLRSPMLTKGDVEGHEFHGNQWTGGEGGATANPANQSEASLRAGIATQNALADDAHARGDVEGEARARLAAQSLAQGGSREGGGIHTTSGAARDASSSGPPPAGMIRDSEGGLHPDPMDPRFSAGEIPERTWVSGKDVQQGDRIGVGSKEFAVRDLATDRDANGAKIVLADVVDENGKSSTMTLPWDGTVTIAKR